MSEVATFQYPAVDASLMEWNTRLGYVYAIEASEVRLVKFGWARHPDRRMEQFQTGCPHSLRLIGFRRGGFKVESAIHEVMRDCRFRSEWFRLGCPVSDRIIRSMHAYDQVLHPHEVFEMGEANLAV